MVVDSICRIQRNLILETVETHRKTTAFSNKERRSNRAQQPHQHTRFQFADKRPQRHQQLIEGDNDLSQCLHEKSTSRTGQKLRRRFATLVLNGAPALRLWAEFIADFTEDFQGVPSYSRSGTYTRNIANAWQTTSSLARPTTHHRLTECERRRQAIDMNRELRYINETYPRLTIEQRPIYDEALHRVTGPTPACFLLNAAAETSKTYALNALSA